MAEAKLASPLLLDALSFAVERHGSVSQARKGTAFPYVLHPLRVAEILRRHEYDDEVVAAGMLHDTIEDAAVSAEEISERFGERVARLVEAVSETDRSLPWRERKRKTIDKVADADEVVLAVLAADKLDNIRSIRDRERPSFPTCRRRFPTSRSQSRRPSSPWMSARLGRRPPRSLPRKLRLKSG